MKHYELTYLISPDVFEEELKNFSAKISNFIQEETGKIEKITEPFRKKLGYFIKERGEGFLTTLNFSLSPEKLVNLEKKLKSEKQVLRYLILTKKPEKVSIKRVLLKKERPFKISPKITKSRSEKESSLLRSKPKKVELKEIDKKIEEILRE